MTVQDGVEKPLNKAKGTTKAYFGKNGALCSAEVIVVTLILDQLSSVNVTCWIKESKK